MVKKVINSFRGLERDFILFLEAGIFLGIGQSVDGSTLTNFYKEKFHFEILQRSVLEIPREMPGFLVFLIVGFLYSLGDVRIAALANLFAAIGMFSLGIIPSNYALMIMFIFVYSAGQHVFMPLSNTIGMSFANDGNLGKKLGQLSAANTIALVTSSVVLWLLFKFLNINYTISFTIGAISFLIASILMFFMNPKQTVKSKSRFVFRKEYKLFYWMSVLYGIRKQIFITFAPWVLVDVFNQKVTTMTALFFLISVISIFFKPFVGYLIDRVGERFVLAGEAGILFFVCLGYAFADNLLPYNGAVLIICACYVLDLTLNAVGMARATYLKKIAVEEEDVSPTLSMGISIDHIMSMFIPTIAGLVWYNGGAGGYKYVFLGGAVVALVNFITTSRISINKNAKAGGELQV